MKSISYQHNWSSKTSEEDELKAMYGDLLVHEDTSEPYEEDEAKLFKKGDTYYLLSANGCSCWEGDWDGWEFTRDELVKWALAQNKPSYSDSSEYQVALWVRDNLIVEGQAA